MCRQLTVTREGYFDELGKSPADRIKREASINPGRICGGGTSASPIDIGR